MNEMISLRQAGIEWVLTESFSGVASELWAFSTKFLLFLGGFIQWNTTKNILESSFNPSLVSSQIFDTHRCQLHI